MNRLTFISPRPAMKSALLCGFFTCLLIFGASLMVSDLEAQHLEVRIHDPVMAQQDDTFYLFGTGRGIAVWSSDDMENWERLDPVFAETPPWTEEIVDGGRYHLWAPDITHHNGKYYLYYSVSAFGRNTSAIGVLSNPTLHPDDPDFEWTDHGKVVRSVPGRDLWNAIDPNIVFDDDGTPWMTFGSFWKGMKLVRLNDNMVEIDRDPQEWHTIAARNRYWKLDDRTAGNDMSSAIEAPFIFKKNGYYYNFVSWDFCCRGEDSTYKVVVGRSKEVTGPYLDKEGEDMRHGGGSLVLQGNENYAGIGHNAAYTFNGTDYLIAHGYDVADEGNSKLLILEMEWDENDWPVVRLGE
ncbi:arabinan endo-1,5-alpha-L-arabinosidase [Rhodohalobacter sp. SW132]|uniref:arabinan endo-1,5-alpha-L-arabinosidase n=1 Tax=Rhodohalobacter sp. SW132 TaxID=2293433 RepID=UPI0018F46821|nr:arabinan endo-1,5-alpha-L-arabinosidase [Rhodohalobacter sp. SW132]